jgi:hypothetical protein
MGGGFHHQPLFLADWIDADSDGLDLPIRRFLVQADTEDATLPEGCGFATPDPPARSGGSGGHQGLLVVIDDGYKHDR